MYRLVIEQLCLFIHLIRPLFGPPGCCYYQPTCGNFALQQLHTQPFWKAIAAIGWRILSCNPLSYHLYVKQCMNQKLLISMFVLACQPSILGSMESKNAVEDLFAAIGKNDYEQVKLLVESGIDINVNNKDNCTPLEQFATSWLTWNMCVGCGQYHDDFLAARIPTLQLLLAKGARIVHQKWHSVYHLVHYVITKQDVYLLQNLIAAGADVTQDNCSNHPPLLCAAITQGIYEIVRILIASKANLHNKDKNDNTPLYYALQRHGDPLLVRLLLNADALLDGKISLENLNSHQKDILLLAGYSVGIEPKNKSEFSFAQAIMQGNTNAVQNYLKSSAPLDINKQYPPHNGTLLMIAAAQGHQDVVRLLLEHGANPLLSGHDKSIKKNYFNVFDILKVILEDSTLSLQQRASYENIVQLCSSCYSKDQGSYLHKLPIPILQHTISFAVGMSLLSISYPKIR